MFGATRISDETNLACLCGTTRIRSQLVSWCTGNVQNNGHESHVFFSVHVVTLNSRVGHFSFSVSPKSNSRFFCLCQTVLPTALADGMQGPQGTSMSPSCLAHILTTCAACKGDAENTSHIPQTTGHHESRKNLATAATSNSAAHRASDGNNSQQPTPAATMGCVCASNSLHDIQPWDPIMPLQTLLNFLRLLRRGRESSQFSPVCFRSRGGWFPGGSMSIQWLAELAVRTSHQSSRQF